MSFFRRRERVGPMRYVPLAAAFKPQIKVLALKDINATVGSGERRVKAVIGKGRVGYLDEPTARAWNVKGYVAILDGTVRAVSPDEAAQILSEVQRVGLPRTGIA